MKLPFKKYESDDPTFLYRKHALYRKAEPQSKKTKYTKAKRKEQTKDISRTSIAGMEKCDKTKGRICADGAVIVLGVETLLCTVVVTGGSDATNIYMQKPDFILAGDFARRQKKGS